MGFGQIDIDTGSFGIPSGFSLLQPPSQSLVGYGAETTFEVEFAPYWSGYHYANVTFDTNVGAGSQLVTGRSYDSTDPPLAFLTGNPTVTEGETASFNVVLSRPAFEEVSFSYQASIIQTAYFPGAFDSGSVTFQPGETEKSITVTTEDDSSANSSRDFQVAMSSYYNGGLWQTSNAGGVILDNDSGPTLTIGNVTVSETAGQVTLTVSLSAQSSSEVGFSIGMDYDWGVDTAAWNVDFVPPYYYVLTIPPYQLSTTWSVSILDDLLLEDDETFGVAIFRSENAHIDGDNRSKRAVITILGEEEPNIAVRDDATETFLSNGSSGVSLEDVLAGVPVERTFNIFNQGYQTLVLDPPSFLEFPNLSLVGEFPAEVAAQETATFTVRFETSTLGT